MKKSATKYIKLALVLAFILVGIDLAHSVYGAPLAAGVGFPRIYSLFLGNGNGAFSSIIGGCDSTALRVLADSNIVELHTYWANSSAVFPCDSLGLVHYLKNNGLTSKKVFAFYPLYLHGKYDDNYYGTLSADINNSNPPKWLWRVPEQAGESNAANPVQFGSTFLFNLSDLNSTNSGFRFTASSDFLSVGSTVDGFRIDQISPNYHQFYKLHEPDYNGDGSADKCAWGGKYALNQSIIRANGAWLNSIRAAGKSIGGNNMWAYRSIPLESPVDNSGLWKQDYTAYANFAMNEDFAERDHVSGNDGVCYISSAGLQRNQRWALAMRAAADWMMHAQDPAAYVILATDAGAGNYPSLSEVYGNTSSATARYLLASALMTDAYFAYAPNENYVSPYIWMPEWSVNTANGLPDRIADDLSAVPHLNWLGGAVGPAHDTGGRTLPDWINLQNNSGRALDEIAAYGWTREFQNGIALVNPTDAAITFSLSGTFSRIADAHDTDGVNVGGAAGGSITLNPHTGIVLYRSSGSAPNTATPTSVGTSLASFTPTATPAVGTPSPTPQNTATSTPTSLATGVFTNDTQVYYADSFAYLARSNPSVNLINTLIYPYFALDPVQSQIALLGFSSLTFGSGAGVIPKGAVIDQAMLTIYATNRYISDNTSATHAQIYAGAAKIPWTQSGVSWNNFPLSSISTNSSAGSVDSIDRSGWPVDIDVAATLQAWANGDPPNGFALYEGYGTNSIYVFDKRATLTVKWHNGSSLNPKSVPTATPTSTPAPAISVRLTDGLTDPVSYPTNVVPLTCSVTNNGATLAGARILLSLGSVWRALALSANPPGGVINATSAQVTWITDLPANTTTTYQVEIQTIVLSANATSTYSCALIGNKTIIAQAYIQHNISFVATPTFTLTPTATPTGSTPTFTPTSTRVPTKPPPPPPILPTAKPTNTPTNTPQATVTPTYTPTPTNTPYPTYTSTSTPTNPPTLTPTYTPVPTSTPFPFMVINEVYISSGDLNLDGLTTVADSGIELYNGTNYTIQLNRCRISTGDGKNLWRAELPPGAYISAHGYLGLTVAQIGGFVIPQNGGSVIFECPYAYDRYGQPLYSLVDGLTLPSAAYLGGRAWARLYDGASPFTPEQATFSYANKP